MGQHLAQNINLPLSERSEIVNTGGLVVGFTGAVNDAVLLFATNVLPTGPAAYMVETNTPNDGTTVTILKAGVYEVRLYLEAALANTVTYGVSQDVAVAGLTGNPSFAIPGFVEVQNLVSVVAATSYPAPISTTIIVSPEQEGGTTIRFHATNGAGAAPAAGSLIAAACYYRIRRVNQAHV